jgi:hypothetical protein
LTKANRRNSDASDIASIGYTVNAIGQRTHATRTGAAINPACKYIHKMLDIVVI